MYKQLVYLKGECERSNGATTGVTTVGKTKDNRWVFVVGVDVDTVPCEQIHSTFRTSRCPVTIPPFSFFLEEVSSHRLPSQMSLQGEWETSGIVYGRDVKVGGSIYHPWDLDDHRLLMDEQVNSPPCSSRVQGGDSTYAVTMAWDLAATLDPTLPMLRDRVEKKG